MTPLSWLGIVRLGVVQAALGAVVVLTTSTLNRIMVVELALPAALPGALVGLHYGLQVLRPRLGYGSDLGRRRTPWILGGMGVLGMGGLLAVIGTALMDRTLAGGVALAVLGFVAIGVGVGAAGTSLLVLLAARTAPARRPAAATIVWIMMFVGFAITATVAGAALRPYSPARLVAVMTAVVAASWIATLLAMRGQEGAAPPSAAAAVRAPPGAFRRALAEVWAEPDARRFAVFVFAAMLAYAGQDLLLEPFAGAVFALPPGATTSLAGTQHAGSVVGMVLVAVLATRLGGLRAWTIGGCLAAAACLMSLGVGGFAAPDWPLRTTVFAMGLSTGIFAAAAIGGMMQRAGAGRPGRQGTRMGLWGAAQALAFGAGGLLATSLVDLARLAGSDTAAAYAGVFALDATLFVVAAATAARLDRPARAGRLSRLLVPAITEADA